VKKRKAKSRAPQRLPKWELGYLEVAEKEARKLLTKDQYIHALELFDDLAHETDPTRSQTQDVRRIEDFYELRDKGGILGNINLRVYFTVIENRRLILALAVYKKEEEDQTPEHIKIKVRNRLRATKNLREQL
jgi:hypothetical protein